MPRRQPLLPCGLVLTATPESDTDAIAAMPETVSICPNCFREFPAPEPGHFGDCNSCGASVRLETFAAWERPPIPPSKEPQPAREGAAVCFEHEDRLAQADCQQCGRLLCGPCSMELAGQTFCPACLELRLSKGQEGLLQEGSTRWDKIALCMALIPFFGITGWIAVGICVAGWRQQRTLPGPVRFVFLLAFLLGLLQGLAAVALILYFVFL